MVYAFSMIVKYRPPGPFSLIKHQNMRRKTNFKLNFKFKHDFFHYVLKIMSFKSISRRDRNFFQKSFVKKMYNKKITDLF